MLALRLVACCFLIAAIFRSYIEVSSGKNATIYSAITNGPSSGSPPVQPGTEADMMKAWVEGRWKDAAPLMRKLQVESETRLKNNYDRAAVDNLILTGQFFLEETAYTDALKIFLSVLEADEKHFGSASSEVGRDLNNLGVVSYVSAKCEKDEARRARLFDNSKAYLDRAQKIFHDASTSPLLAKDKNIVDFNRIPVMRDCGDKVEYNKLRAAHLFDLP